MSAASDRSIRTIISEMDFLKEENIVSGEEYDKVVSVLKSKTREAKNGDGNNQRPAASLPPQNSGQNNNQNSNQEMFVAKYEFKPHESTDLALTPGMKVRVLERLSADWWRGKDLGSNNEGVFPSNYVEPANVDDEKAMQRYESNQSNNNTPPPGNYYGQQNYNQNGQGYPQPYQQQMQPQNSGYQPPFYPQQQQVQQQQQEQQVQQQQPQQEHRVNDGLKRFGKKFGNAAVFGAGATLGSDIMHHII